MSLASGQHHRAGDGNAREAASTVQTLPGVATRRHLWGDSTLGGGRGAGPDRTAGGGCLLRRTGIRAPRPGGGCLDRQLAPASDRLGSATPQAERRQRLGGLGAGVRPGSQGLWPGGAAAVHTQQPVASRGAVSLGLLVRCLRPSARYGYRPLARPLERLPRTRRQPRLGLRPLGTGIHSRRIDSPPFPQLHGRQPVYGRRRQLAGPASYQEVK